MMQRVRFVTLPTLAPRSFLALLLILTLALRLAAVLSLRDITQFHGEEMGQDAYHYDALARSLLAGEGYVLQAQPTAFRAPGFPGWLALVYGLSGSSYAAAYLSMIVLGLIAVWATYRAGVELGGETLGRLAGLCLALYPPHVYTTTIFASENLFVTLLALTTWLGVRALRSTQLLSYAAFGAVLGLAVLTRPFVILALPLLALVVVLRERSWAGWRAAALLCLATAALVAPWTVRNTISMQHPVVLTTSGGPTFWGGNNDRVLNEARFAGGWVASDQLPGWQILKDTDSEVQRDALQWQWGKNWVRAHLADMPGIVGARALRFLLPDRDSDNANYVRLQWLGYTPFLALVLWALLRRFTRAPLDSRWWIADSLMLACIATAFVFWGAPRFRDGNAPILMLYAATALLPWVSGTTTSGAPGASKRASKRADSSPTR